MTNGKRRYSERKGLTARVLILALLLAGVTGANVAWGQNKASLEEGFYYIIWGNDATNYYLAPGTRATQDFFNSNSATPYLRPTATVSDGVIWEIRNAGDGNYYLIHYSDGNYVVLNKTAAANNEPSEAVHLEASPADLTSNTVKFYLTKPDDYYRIFGLYNTYASFNPFGGKNGITSANENGRIGLYRSTDGGSRWKIEKIGEVEAPVITLDYTNNKISLSCSTDGASIYYVTGDRIKPLSPTSTKYEPDLDMELGRSYYLTAYAKTDDGRFSLITSKKIDTRTMVADPVISNDGNNISITCATEDVDIYYTTDGSEPTTASTHYDGTFTLDSGRYRYTINAKVILRAASSNVVSTTVDFRTSLPKPVITLNDGKTQATITYEGGADGDVIKYTTDGTDPTFSSPTYTTALDINQASVNKIKAIAFNKEGTLSSRTATKFVNGYEPRYVAIHQNGSGYLRVNNGNVDLTNDGNFRYSNLYDGNGNSIWVLTNEGYLKNGYYYLNVANGTTLYLSVEPVTQWELDEVDGNGKMSIRYEDKYLCNNGGIKLEESPTASYHACPITIEETNWKGPSTDALTLQSPQLVTYLRHYFTQTFNYSFVDDAGATKAENGKDRRVFALLTYASGGGDGKGTTWDVTGDGSIIYSKQATGNVDVTANYSMTPADPLAANLHPTPATASIKFTLQPRYITPDPAKNYLLFNVDNGDWRFPYGTADAAENSKVTIKNNKNTSLTNPANDEISWKIVDDGTGLYSFQNVASGRYLYFDTSDYTASNWGMAKYGGTTLPAGDNRYKFRLYRSSHGTYGNVVAIIPYSHQHLVWKSDAVSISIRGSFNVFTTPQAISLNRADQSRWRIYAYEVEDRLTSNWTLNGPNNATETGDYGFTATAYYSQNIKESPANNRDLEIPGTYTKTGVTYDWTVSGLDGYVTTTDNSSGGDGRLTVTVNSMPTSNVLGTVKVTAKYTVDGKNLNNSKTVRFNLYPPIVTPTEFTEISSLSKIDNPAGAYRLTQDASDAVPTDITNFTGFLDGGNHTVSGLSAPLFATITGGTVCNLNLSNVSISGGDNAGAIAGTATGNARIYNIGVLDGTVSGSGYVGSIVGLLDGSARVINCFSYATVNGGTNVGGIVGYNSYASTALNLMTMVMNCMFYGNATGTNVAPIYGGLIINNNSNTGLNNFNYFSAEDFISDIDTYNCALGAEKRFLTRFEFYRQILNSNRELAAWYVDGSHDRSIIAKWVLETADRAITNPKPYPVLRPQGTYPSIVNMDAEHAPDSTSVGRNHGGKLGKTLSVTVSGVGSNAPTGASLNQTSLTLIRTDKDFDRFNFNYDKVQLPYYNDVGTGNYTDNKVVTGWKIISITDGTAGTFTGTGADVVFDGEGNVTTMPYNFADRNCTQKDLYTVSDRVFSQGAYFDVPYGVTAITIEPYWATAAYLSDPNYDKTYTKDYGGGNNIAVMGTRYVNDQAYLINGSSQKVYTTMGDAINALGRTSGKTVYDYAVVLVGNYHHYYGKASVVNDGNGFTIMSADLDFDNEPDNCLIYQHTDRQNISPVRFDFLCWPGIGMAQKPSDSPRLPGIGIFKPKGWFEVTNTCIAQFFEFEYDFSGKTNNTPLILQGGVFEQIVSTFTDNPNHTSYIHIGGNVWFKMFNNGTHASGNNFTPHRPISVTGGCYDEFYLSGMFKPTATANADNAECYISGGYFKELASGGMEQIMGDVYWQIYNADIDNFYGGGINAVKAVTGNIETNIYNSNVGTFCGGPKFGDMTAGKTVTTTANGGTFGNFFGAGYGGTSYNRDKTRDQTNQTNYGFSGWVNSDYSRQYNSGKGGIATSFEYELFAYAGFGDNNNVGRFYVNYASLSLATTHDVTSTLTGCNITNNFYGGGNIGKVNGNIISTLTDCTVGGDVFGAGFSAKVSTVDVMKKEAFSSEPFYDQNAGIYKLGVFPESVTYTWKQAASVSAGNEFDEENHYILTTVDMTGLGTVLGNVTLNVGGTTTVAGDVYGGGALASSNTGNPANLTTVNLTGGVIEGSVYGGGMGRMEVAAVTAVEATVGSTLVKLNGTVTQVDDGNGGTTDKYLDDCVVKGNIFGCNNVNGTPLGNATVHIYKTQGYEGHMRTDSEKLDNTDDSQHSYELNAVYGGGNLAAYVPTDLENCKATVIIDGCELTSIKTVYGGGNAASTPATQVDINGTYEIEEVFGGGNGKDVVSYDGGTTSIKNPGANVGYKNYSTYNSETNTWIDNEDADTKDERLASSYIYGTGAANVNIYGGRVHRVFGGSNTKGNVRITAVTMLEDAGGCEFCVDEAYGGGKEAPMDAEAKLLMACIPGLSAAYGGAEAANVEGGVTLTITNGTFDRVFGGNNKSGTIGGPIVVNIEETGCRPIVIGKLYGGGNLAAYSVYGYDDEGNAIETGTKLYKDPIVNIKSFTSIGEVYGGGYGETAKMVASPTVNINVTEGKFKERVIGENATTATIRTGNADAEGGYPVPSHASGEIGAINNVYGGGDSAPVKGDTYVNIATRVGDDEYMAASDTDVKDDTTFPTGYYTRSGEGTEGNPYTYTDATGTTPDASTTYYKKYTIKGVDIRGNIYGGGNNAEVTGDTNVVIGKKVGSGG